MIVQAVADLPRLAGEACEAEATAADVDAAIRHQHRAAVIRPCHLHRRVQQLPLLRLVVPELCKQSTVIDSLDVFRLCGPT